MPVEERPLRSLIADFPRNAAGQPISVEAAVHDGDTVRVLAEGETFSVRMLGVDTPEVSFYLPEDRCARVPFFGIGNQRWQQFLDGPLAETPIPFFFPAPEAQRCTPSEQPGTARQLLGRGLVASLAQRVGPGCALNHAEHARRAHQGLEKLIKDDLAERQQQGRPYRFFLAFAYEDRDRYGRRLAFIHREERPDERQPSYNARMLEAGLALPYFIWPNINPFRTKPTIQEAVPTPGQLGRWLADAPTFQEARKAVRRARNGGRGVYEEVPNVGKLRLQPFEIRFLADRRAPDRYVLDLSEGNRATRLYPPTLYYKIRFPENRLFINREHLQLFLDRGWQVR